jgi:hypothetical protein
MNGALGSIRLRINGVGDEHDLFRHGKSTKSGR